MLLFYLQARQRIQIHSKISEIIRYSNLVKGATFDNIHNQISFNYT